MISLRLQLEVETAGVPQALNGRTSEGENIGRRNGRKLGPDPGQDAFQHEIRRFAFVPWRQYGKGQPHVFAAAAQEAESTDGDHMVHAGGAFEKCCDLLHHPVGAGKGRRFGQLNIDEKDPLVFSGQKAGGTIGKHEPGARENQHEGSKHHQFSSDQPCGCGYITGSKDIQKAAEPGQGAPLDGATRPQQDGAQGGTQGQGVYGRENNSR